MHALLLSLPLLALTSLGPDVAVVCPTAFREALQPWLEYRGRQGHRIELVSSEGTPEAVRGRIRDLAKGGTLRVVVLVGDVGSNPAANSPAGRPYVPVFFAPAKVNVRWGSEPTIATDNPYADLDDDRLPDVAIGRLPVSSPDELSRLVRKVLAYEANQQPSGWRRQVNFIAGLGGFGALADALLESAAKTVLTAGVPAAYATTMTYASWRSPYCPDPKNFHEATLDRINEGCLFWVYIGHGSPDSLDRAKMPDGDYHILGRQDAGQVRCMQGSPIAIFLACYTAAFDAPQACLGEELLRQERGPVAVLGGSRVTMPYGMAVLGTELMSECFDARRATLGEAVLNAKRRSMGQPRDPEQRKLLDGLAAALSPPDTNLADERAEHLLLFNLLGDPLLRLPHPAEARVEAPASTLAGDKLSIACTSPIDGDAEVELVVRRDRLTFKPAPRHEYDSSTAARAEYQDVYRRANDTRLAKTHAQVRGGRLATELDVPSTAWGNCHVRVFVTGANQCALGSTDVTVRRAVR